MSMPMPLECRHSRECWRKVIKSDCDAPDACELFSCTHQRALLLEAFDVLDAMHTRAETAERERNALLEILAEEACPYKEGQCIKTTDPDPSPETLCRPCWEEWLEKNGSEEGALA